MNTQKFDTCRHRSEEKEAHGWGCGGCGGSMTLIEGYFCNRLGVPDLQPCNCEHCIYFSAKDESSLENER